VLALYEKRIVMLAKIKVPSSVLIIMVIWMHSNRSSSLLVYVGGYVVTMSRAYFASFHRRPSQCLIRQFTVSHEKSTLLIGDDNEAAPMDFTKTFGEEIRNPNDMTLVGPRTKLTETSMWSNPPLLETAESRTSGSKEGYYIVKMYKTDPAGFDLDRIPGIMGNDLHLERLKITSHNLTVPLALTILDPEEYPSTSQARKACRKANIIIYRPPIQMDVTEREVLFDASKWQRARVGDRVVPGDILAKQVRIGDGVFPTMHHKKPPFDLPVIFEDDHFAIGGYIHCDCFNTQLGSQVLLHHALCKSF
jgi:hypothetical protein